MSPLSETRWEFVPYHDNTSMMLGYIRCTVWHGCQQYDYNFAISRDYTLMRQKNDYFWHVIERMAMELAECLM